MFSSSTNSSGGGNNNSLGQAFLVSLLPERSPWIGRVNHSLTMVDGQMYRFGGRLVRNQIDVPGPYYQELETLNPVGCLWDQVLEGTARERSRKLYQQQRMQGGKGGSRRGVVSSSSRGKKKRLNRGHNDDDLGGGDEKLPPEPNKRGDHSATVIHFSNHQSSNPNSSTMESSTNNSSSASSSKLYIFGGRMQLSPLSDMYSFDFSTKEWSPIVYETSSGPGPIFGHAAVASQLTKRIYVTGGWHSRQWRTPLWAFETGTNTWLEIPRPPHVQMRDVNTLRRCALAAWEGTIYIVGWPLTPIDAQPFISNIPILAYNEMRNEWSEVAAIGNPPPAVLCSLCLANSVVMPHLGCWTFLCVGDDGKSNITTDRNNNKNNNNSRHSNRRTNLSRSPSRVSSFVSNASSSVLSSSSRRNPSMMMMKQRSMSSSRNSNRSMSSASVYSSSSRSPGRGGGGGSVSVNGRILSSSKNNTSNSNNNSNNNNNNNITTKGDLSEAQMLGSGLLPNVPNKRSSAQQQFNLAAQQASSTRGGNVLLANSNINNITHPPTLWSFHFATCRWIQHKIFLSQSTIASSQPDQFSMPILTSRLNESNTDPFETKYSLVVTGSDSLVMWGGSLDRDHVAIRLKLSVEGANKATLTHQSHNNQFGMIGAGGGNNMILSPSTRRRLASSTASARGTGGTLSGSRNNNNNSIANSVGLALPLPLHRQMRNNAKRQSHSARMFGSNTTSFSGGGGEKKKKTKNEGGSLDKKKKKRKGNDDDEESGSSSNDSNNSSSSSSSSVGETKKKKKKQHDSNSSKSGTHHPNSNNNSNMFLMNEFQKNTEDDRLSSTSGGNNNNNPSNNNNNRHHRHRRNIQNPTMQPIKLSSSSLVPIVRLGNTDQIDAWRKNYYNEQVEWLFSTYAKDVHNSSLSSKKNRDQQQQQYSSLQQQTARSSSSSTNNNNNNNNKHNPNSLLHDEMKHRKHAPVNIELNQLGSVSTSVAWPLYPVRNLPVKNNNNNASSSSFATRLRWMLVKRYVRSGWAKTGIYPSEATMQGWRDGRVIVKFHQHTHNKKKQQRS